MIASVSFLLYLILIFKPSCLGDPVRNRWCHPKDSSDGTVGIGRVKRTKHRMSKYPEASGIRELLLCLVLKARGKEWLLELEREAPWKGSVWWKDVVNLQ